MEFSVANGKLFNGYHENVQIEEDLVFPYLKSSDIANGQTTPKKKILVTQKCIGEPTSFIESKYPAVWKYLLAHSIDFEKRFSPKNDFPKTYLKLRNSTKRNMFFPVNTKIFKSA